MNQMGRRVRSQPIPVMPAPLNDNQHKIISQLMKMDNKRRQIRMNLRKRELEIEQREEELKKQVEA